MRYLALLLMLPVLALGCGGGGGGGTSSSGGGVIPLPLSIVTTTLPFAVASAPYSRPITAANGTTRGYTWDISAGALPSGLTLSATGTPSTTISGTPAAAGSFAFTVRVRDDAGAAATQALTLEVRSVVAISTTTLPTAVSASAYTATVSAAGGSDAGFTWRISSGALPAGLTITAAGTPSTSISGTPGASGAFNFTVEVRDSLGNTDTQPLALTVTPALSITTSTLPTGTAGITLTATPLTGAGGSGSGYVWSRVSGLLPNGLTYLATGTPATSLFGTPTLAGTFSFTVGLEDSLGAATSRAYTMTINPAMSISTASPLPVAVEGGSYAVNVTATGGSGAGYTWSISAGALPAGLTISAGPLTPATQISGTPTVNGTGFAFTIRAADNNGASITKAFTMDVNPPIAIFAPTAGALPAAVSGTAYAVGIAARDGTRAGYVWTLDSGTLPAGLTLTAAATKATISGVPSQVGGFNFALRVTDDAGNTDIESYSIAVAAPSSELRFVTRVLPSAATNTAYAQQIVAAGGTAPYTFLVTSGAPPTGITIDAGGLISGVTTATGVFAFGVELTDSAAPTPATRAAQFILDVVRGEQRWTAYVGDGSAQDMMFYVDHVASPGTGIQGRSTWASTANVGTSLSFNHFSPDGLSHAFRADLDVSQKDELYLVNLGGSAPSQAVRFGATQTALGDMVNFVWSPNSRHVLYCADVVTDTVQELWMADATAPGTAARVNGTMTTGGATGGDVVTDPDGAWSFSPDGTRVAYLADQDVDAQIDLYVVDVSAPGVTKKLNGAFAPGASSNASKFLWLNPTTILYLAQKDAALTSRDEVYAIDVTAPAPAEVRISPRPAHAGEVGSIADVAPSPDGTRVAFKGDLETLAFDELYLVEFSGSTPGAARKISPGTTGGFETVASFQWSPDGKKIALVGDLGTTLVDQLYVIDLSGPTPGGALRVGDPAAAVVSSITTGYLWSPDSSKLAFRSGADLFVADVSGAIPGAAQRVNPTLVTAGAVVRMFWSPDSARLAYVADQEEDGVDELYVASVAAPGTSQRVNPDITGNKDVSSADVYWSRGSDRIIYRSNQDAVGTSQTPRHVYMSDLTTPFPFTNVRVSSAHNVENLRVQE